MRRRFHHRDETGAVPGEIAESDDMRSPCWSAACSSWGRSSSTNSWRCWG